MTCQPGMSMQNLSCVAYSLRQQLRPYQGRSRSKPALYPLARTVARSALRRISTSLKQEKTYEGERRVRLHRGRWRRRRLRSR
ncbi:hypothetical protein, partial [Pseudomonas aeruginosa]|uniref:hypothetical protein n=1 Tax=Pseudomonas aeruginosa TaxID=287 RepID=UPI001C3840C3